MSRSQSPKTESAILPAHDTPRKASPKSSCKGSQICSDDEGPEECEVKFETNTPSSPSNARPNAVIIGSEERADVCIIVGEGDATHSFEFNAGVLASTSAEWDKILPDPATAGKPCLVLPAIDPAAMEVLLHACHFEYGLVPMTASPDLLYQIASTLSSFEMGPVVAMFAPAWLDSIRDTIHSPQDESRERQPAVPSRKRKRSRRESEAGADAGGSSQENETFEGVSEAMLPSARLADTHAQAPKLEHESVSRYAAERPDHGSGESLTVMSIVPDSDRVILISWELGDKQLFLCAARTLINDSSLGDYEEVVGPSDLVLTNHRYNGRMMGMIDSIIQMRADIVAMAFRVLSEMQIKLCHSLSCTVQDCNTERQENCARVILGAFVQFLLQNPDLNCLDRPAAYKGTVRDLVRRLQDGASVRVRARHANCNAFAQAVARITDYHLDVMRSVRLTADQVAHMSLRSATA
ncbi:uncharacterized protein VDAG_03350 [Verticillium dahliae VdLs.17]|uniref:BTB domain-containing protein n=1 Tax=Verticillium dahliae (strain VdLs.17 / ATCC MYA-4575 / FGSC 10137) TaxID=498257 RepID=G2WZA8_VERDV|nr:uncharacterized protein VDAG_03350 [Verticillium dahliae VdLs.17]EGY21910.1 hypothetical protein VDAG_03350 [Verticillium dahliae VdLs.17]